MKHRYLRALLLLGLGLALASCSITRIKWRIKWNKDMEKSKAAFIGAPIGAEPERQPNIIVLLADDLGPLNFDFNYTISMNSATKTDFRTNTHVTRFFLGWLF